MSRLRVFREADFADDEAPTEPGGFALAQGTGNITVTVRPDADSAQTDSTTASGATATT